MVPESARDAGLVRRLFRFSRLHRSFESPRYLLKWLILSSLIGIVAGIGAIVFYSAIHYANHWFIEGIVGYVQPSPAGEGPTTIMSFWNSARPCEIQDCKDSLLLVKQISIEIITFLPLPLRSN
ncbi:hypothetical protein KSZ_20370 [Dictyobacter formicarum]|uniref:Chloride channel protein n=1 Tax=Dictyobacter formicarum TaxID=2778368 RepID=A0ABQ3VFY2_9CHLR|nr:hypothetical protein KSZ_20370 [Dictyobacter formicarum]